ncbi:SusC/RagA family TonB-linked outer membrane protein [Sphingobacterium haloxyli]|uniref:SusC/RagA family protein n=1 Tax=Sphingobacterium haloxyli TaxID=2100533 RepID=A0A2S9J8S8_9SPHI|nr:SusC/RagA family TonB-linked outer membrane protein [Sphingobacterium haloxyli]PRD49193.1 SusC/RagA family protein [Sphingobacterium haloxyli]
MNYFLFDKRRKEAWTPPIVLILRTMKITTFLLLVFMTCAYAEGTAQKVSLSLKNAKLEDAFQQISRQTNLKFLYNDDVIAKSSRVNLNVRETDVKDALHMMLPIQNYAFKIIAGTVTVNYREIEPNVATVTVEAQNTITGRVTTMNGEPLAGVSIGVRGTSQGTTTNENGNFSISVPPGSTLSFRYVGYLNRDITLGNQRTLNVQLTALDQAIEEVVVTGVGLQLDKRTFTGATASISGADAEIGGMIDPSRGLEGRVAGVTVQNITGTFGTAPKIRVRGATSIFGNSKPLWVLDGIIIEDVADVGADALSSGDALTLISSAVAGLNANDIESFQILKDGSATSIYGARGMAGVIVITTKKGRAGRSTVNYSGEYTSRAIPRYSEFNIMNSQEQMSVYQEMYQKGYLGLAQVTNAASSGVYGELYDQIVRGDVFNDFFLDRKEVNAHLREAEYRNTDWFSELFSTTIQHNHSLSLSSGTEKAQYYTSISALQDAGWTKASGVSRFTGNLNANYNISDKLRLNMITGGSYRDQKAPGTLAQSTDAVFGEVRRDFDINPYSYAMNTSRTLDANTFYRRNYAPFNILHELENNYMDNTVSDIRFQGELTYRPIKVLEFKALGSVRFQSTAQNHHIKDRSNQATAMRWMPTTAIRDANPFLYTDPNDPYAIPVTVLPEGGIYNRADHSMRAEQYRFSVKYDNTFAEKHNLTLFGMTDIQRNARNNTWFRGFGLQYDLGESPFSHYLAFKQGQEQNSQYFAMFNTRSRDVAFAAQGVYTFDDKYSLNSSVRYEGSNRLGMATSSRWMPTWSIGGLWHIDYENFFEVFRPVVSNWTMRASYGLTGDRGPSFVTNAHTVIAPFRPWRPNVVDNESGLTVVEVENSELTYEKKYEFNIGTDIGLFNNRLNIQADYFKRNNHDLIGIVNTQGMGGQIAKYGNVARMDSRGFELTVGGDIIRTSDFQWNSSFIYTNVTNNVVELESNYRAIDLISGAGFAREGTPHRALFSIPFDGLNNEGLPTFLNENGDKTVTGVYFQERERLDYLVYNGPMEPTDLGSFSNILTYKNFRLNAFITYSFGNSVRLNPVFARAYSDLTATPREFASRWIVPGDEEYTDIPTIATIRQNRNNSNLSYAYNAYNFSTARVASGDFIRLKDISLSYDFPKEFLSRYNVSAFSLRLNATNTFLLYADKKLNGQDPEFVNAGGVAAPLPRQYTLTLRFGL